jgi:Zn ribbon nucleic-acid-binding protein
MNKIKERKKVGATCPKCKSPDYIYNGRAYEPDGKHQFECKSCGNFWQYGKIESKYTLLK